MQGKKLLLVGCGELGSRHLQAIATLPEVAEIHIVDPRDQSLVLGRERLKEITDFKRVTHFFWHHELDEKITGGDLCIIATQAKGRPALVKQIANELGYKKFLIEKVVSQSVDEYRNLMLFCQKENISVWVNCKTRAYEIHQYIKSRLNSNEPIKFFVFGGNHGLANNGVHIADIFAFHDNARQITSAGSNIDPILHPSKRGKDVFDLSGMLRGVTDKGSELSIVLTQDPEIPISFYIMTHRSRFIIEHFQKFAYESYADSGWEWKKIPVSPADENWNVSHMTKAFAADILSGGKCKLPTLVECFPAHEFILNQLLPCFNRLTGADNNYCPVT